jgi:hypothetical protein
MAQSKSFTLSSIGTSMPDGAATAGPSLTETVSPAVKTAGSLVLSGAFQQITVPTGATVLCLYMGAQANNVTIAGANTDTGINIGSGWSFQKINVVAGTTTFWVKIAAGAPTLNYEFN